jgi:DNA-binding CsgD family transcriptional regulator
MDYATIFLLILAVCFSVAALALTRGACRSGPRDYLKCFYYRLWMTFAYTVTSSAATLSDAESSFSSGWVAIRVCLALVCLWAMTLIYGEAFFQAQACLNLVGRSLNRPYRLLLCSLLLASLILVVFLFIFAEGQKRKNFIDLLFYLAVFVNSSYTVVSSAFMIMLTRTWSTRGRKAALRAGALFISVVATYVVIAVLGQLGWMPTSLFTAQMLAKAILFNAFVLMYLKAFLAAVAESEFQPATGLSGAEAFIRQYAISKREQEIIQLICEGESNDEIGQRLFISLPTVKGHVYNIFQKTGVKNRIQLANLVRVCNSQESKGSLHSLQNRTQSH